MKLCEIVVIWSIVRGVTNVACGVIGPMGFGHLRLSTFLFVILVELLRKHPLFYLLLLN